MSAHRDFASFVERLEARRATSAVTIDFPNDFGLEKLDAMISALTNMPKLNYNGSTMVAWEDDFGLISIVRHDRACHVEVIFLWADDPMYDVVKQWL